MQHQMKPTKKQLQSRRASLKSSVYSNLRDTDPISQTGFFVLKKAMTH